MVNFDDFCLWEDHLTIDYDVDEENQCKDQGRYIRDDILMNQGIVSRLKDRIRIHKTGNDKLKMIQPPDQRSEMFMACQSDMLDELQKILEEEK